MSYITLHTGRKKAKIYYQDSDPNSKKPVIFFAHGLLWNSRMWDEQVTALKADYRCIRMDFRGQGKSAITKSGYDMDSLADDVIALLDALNITHFNFVGLSMGGFVGQRIALSEPERLKNLILLDTSADPEPTENLPGYRLLMKIASVLGPKVVMRDLVKIMHGETFRKQAKKDKAIKQRLAMCKDLMAETRRRSVKKIVTGVIERDGVYNRIQHISQPTLIMVGDEDVATTVQKAQRIHMKIAGSKLAILEQAGHMSALEKPDEVSALIRDFLAA